MMYFSYLNLWHGAFNTNLLLQLFRCTRQFFLPFHDHYLWRKGRESAVGNLRQMHNDFVSAVFWQIIASFESEMGTVLQMKLKRFLR